jgi:nitrate reductase gamma subunit
MHLRWELYPLPGEEPERANRGGSHSGRSGLLSRPWRARFLGELKFMIPEILLLKGLWKFNRGMWYRSFPFHLGVYLLICTLVLLALGVSLSLLAPALIAGPAGAAIRLLYGLSGMAGSALTILGALGLLVHRLTDNSLKAYTTAGDIFNLLFFLAALAVLSAGYLSRGGLTPDMMAFAQGLVTFDTGIRIPGLLAAGLLLSALLVAYVPLTHMSHFIAKYFTYHAVLWDDAPNLHGGRLEARVAEVLTFRPTWSAEHVGADGKRTWAQIAASGPARESKP